MGRRSREVGCRSGRPALLVGVYYLGRSLEGMVVKEGKVVGVVTEGRRIACAQVGNLHPSS